MFVGTKETEIQDSFEKHLATRRARQDEMMKYCNIRRSTYRLPGYMRVRISGVLRSKFVTENNSIAWKTRVVKKVLRTFGTL